MAAAILLVAGAAVGAQQPRPGVPPLTVLPVQGNVHLIAGAGANITVQTGKGGVVLVDTPPPLLSAQVMAEVRRLSGLPIRYIIDTSIDADHAGGNAVLAGPVAPGFAFVGLGRPSIIAHENVLNRMANPPAGQPSIPGAALPTTEYDQPTMDTYFNVEAIILYHAPAAHTDGDTMVFFRKSDVISTGDVFTPGRYPVIDVQKGGSVRGTIKALTAILQIAVPEAFEEGGTRIVPGHGRICEETDVAEFRDMVVIVRDRVADLVKKGMSLDQVKAARPSRDYDAEYNADGADTFVEAIYSEVTTSLAPGGRL